MRKTLDGQLVLVTGASSGIGRAAAAEFARRGARVLAVARSAERLDRLSAELGGPSRVAALPADVTDGPAMEALARGVIASHGAPDVVVANAGVGLDARFEHTTDEEMRALFEVNVFGVVRTVRPFLPSMIRRGSGRVLLVSSVVGLRGIPNYSAYCGSKFALHGMADALRAELHGTGVSVGVVCPSSTATEFGDRIRRTEGPRQRRTRLAMHSAESVARALVRMARSGRRRMVLSAEGKLMLVASTIAPGLLDRLMARVLVARR